MIWIMYVVKTSSDVLDPEYIDMNALPLCLAGVTHSGWEEETHRTLKILMFDSLHSCRFRVEGAGQLQERSAAVEPDSGVAPSSTE